MLRKYEYQEPIPRPTSYSRRGPTIGKLKRKRNAPRSIRKGVLREERQNRLEWYFREYGRPPTYEEIIALRDKDYIG